MNQPALYRLSAQSSGVLRWKLGQHTNLLELEADGRSPYTLLTPDFAAQVRAPRASDSKRPLCLELPDHGISLALQNIRRSAAQWAGTATATTLNGTDMFDLKEELAFTEKVISEVNSMVLIVDRRGIVRRFNRLCEDALGLREADVLGKDALDLFMAPDEAAKVRASMSASFAALSTWETTREMATARGPRVIHWRNKVVRSGVEDRWFLICSGWDVTDETRAKETVEKQDRFVRSALEQNPAAILIKTPEGKYLYANQAARELLGRTEAEIIGARDIDVYGADRVPVIHLHDRRALESAQTVSFETTLTVNGRTGYFLCRKVALMQADGQRVILTSMSDLSQIRDAQQALIEKESLHSAVIEKISNGLVITNIDGRVLDMNPAAEEILGCSLASMRGAIFSFGAEPFPGAGDFADRATVDVSRGESSSVTFSICNRATNETVWLSYRASSLSVPGAPEAYGVLHTFDDVTETYEAQRQLYQLANCDALTGLPNRHNIQAQVRAMPSNPAGAPFGILFIDLDNFKRVNDHFGHDQGDQLLQATAQAIRECLRDTDTLARLGGDEFLVIVQNSGTQHALETVAQRILQRVRKPFRLRGTDVYSTCSIGLAMYPTHGTTPEELIRSADTAMYVAKDSGKQGYRVFDPDMDSKVEEYLWLDRNLREALEQNQFELHYQPKVSLQSGVIEGVEALVRWNSPERGQIAPMDFIPYAEESGLIVPLGLWVLNAAAAQSIEWQRRGINLRIAVNMSARQLEDPSVLDNLSNALSNAPGYKPLLDIELTESWLVNNQTSALELIEQFQELGVQVHLDDFGTGYSSLSQLARLPMDVIKMDRSFINSVSTDAKARALVRSMSAVAKELNVKIVAEGVETTEQADFLRDIDVDYVQGYLYARPVSVEAFEAWYRDRGEVSRPIAALA